MKIGNLEINGNVFLAPMAGITDTPFRRIVQEFGISALWTEMISADGVLAARAEFRTIYLDGHEVPTFFQISGTRPDNMANAATILADSGASAIDINMGCPARRVVSRGSGAALMKDLPLAAEITKKVRKAIRLPLTVKIRSGWDEKTKNAVEFARVLESEGCDGLIIHSRSRSKVHSGPADLDIIKELKESVMIPVIGNGGITTFADARKMIQESDCDGIMVGRGALGRPWFPSTLLINGLDTDRPDLSTVTYADVIQRHLHYQLQWWGELSAIRKMRKHLAWYSRGFANGADFRQKVFRLESAEQVLNSVERFFGKVALNEI
jgi:tRNA-dihydrouridine synthase B